MELYSLNELGSQIEEGDMLLEGTITIKVDVSIERAHTYEGGEAGKPQLILGKGWLVSLVLPSSDTMNAEAQTFLDGESQMVGDLKYLGEEGSQVRFEDAIQALDIDADAKIWQVKQAP
jgi:hypothetical protein